jgi:hypothetical protein
MTATTETPMDCPKSLDIVLIPPAPPLRSRGALAAIARLFGAPKKPNPMPPTAARQMIWNVVG